MRRDYAPILHLRSECVGLIATAAHSGLAWILFKRGTDLAHSPLAPEPLMSLRLCILYIVNEHLYAFYIYMHDLSSADGLKSRANASSSSRFKWLSVQIFSAVMPIWQS